jgi:hypothetical protein
MKNVGVGGFATFMPELSQESVNNKYAAAREFCDYTVHEYSDKISTM